MVDNMVYKYVKEALPVPVLEGHKEWVELYDMAWEMAFHNVEYIEKHGWKPQLTCMPGVGIIWQWDSCFMTFITNYSNGTLSAFNNLDNLYRLRRECDGFMAMAYEIEREVEAYPGRINPPLMAWAEWEYYVVTGDSSRFEKVLPALVGCYQFIEKNRRRSCGLYWFEDSGSSGMDNSPRSGYPSENLDGSDVCFVDLACQQALSAKCLANIYTVLRDEKKSDFYRHEHQRICELINRFHWSEREGFYFDFFSRDSQKAKVKFINSKTAAAFWTLICGCAEGERKERMVTHLLDENEFYTRIPFASLSKDDPNYDKNGGYWLGGVWAPTNYIAIRGLAENGYPALAREAAIRYLSAMCNVAKDEVYGSIWECYAPEFFRPATTENGGIVRNDFVGWSGLAPITMLIENILGFRFNVPENKVEFRLFPNQIGGLRNINFGDNRISVECEKYVPEVGKSILRVDAEKSFTLIVETNYLWEDSVIIVPEGKHEFRI